MYLTPGVYVEEVSTLAHAPARWAQPSVAAFIGLAPGGPTTPMRVGSWGEFGLVYADPADPGQGPFMADAVLAHAVFGYFANGGQVGWIVRVQRPDGVDAVHEALAALATIEEVTIVAAPDLVALAVADVAFRAAQTNLIVHCEAAGDRMAILDPPPELAPQAIHEWRTNAVAYDTRHAALYWPWIEVVDPVWMTSIQIPPSGHVAGSWVRSDHRRGIHKAPANEALLGAHALAYHVTDVEQGMLNMTGINVLRAFAGRGIRAWGARTLSSDPAWRFINHRRFVTYVARSLTEQLRWATFKPNDPTLWLDVAVATASFLTRLWRDGALLGATPDEAFFVRCDAEINGPDAVAAGVVNVEVGVALVRPAEFVVFRLAPIGANPLDVVS